MFACKMLKVGLLAYLSQSAEVRTDMRGSCFSSRQPIWHGLSFDCTGIVRLRGFARTSFNPDPQHQPAPLVILLVPLRDPGLQGSEIWRYAQHPASALLGVRRNGEGSFQRQSTLVSVAGHHPPRDSLNNREINNQQGLCRPVPPPCIP